MCCSVVANKMSLKDEERVLLLSTLIGSVHCGRELHGRAADVTEDRKEDGQVRHQGPDIPPNLSI